MTAFCALALIFPVAEVVGQPQPEKTLTGHKQTISCLAFSPDGKTLASGGVDQALKRWDLTALNERSSVVEHTDAINCVAYSRDGKLLASAGWDQMVRLWDPATGS